MIDVDKAIASAAKSGKITLGAREALRSVRNGKARMILIASNTPDNLRENLENYGKLSEIPIIKYDGSSLDLGRICGKRFPIGTLTIKEPGDSGILQLIDESEKHSHSNEIEETD
jgi:large subunit ribosomal protein L30e